MIREVEDDFNNFSKCVLTTADFKAPLTKTKRLYNIFCKTKVTIYFSVQINTENNGTIIKSCEVP